MVMILSESKKIQMQLSEALPFLQTNKLVWYRHVDAGGRHKTPGSEANTLLFTAITAAKVL